MQHSDNNTSILIKKQQVIDILEKARQIGKRNEYEAGEFAETYLPLLHEVNDPRLTAEYYLLISDAYTHTGRFKEGEFYLEQAISKCPKTPENDDLLANCYQNKAMIHYQKGEYSLALSNFYITLKMNIQDKLSEAFRHQMIGAMHLNLKKYEKAIEHGQKAIQLGLKNNIVPDFIGATHINIGSAYRNLNDYKKSIEHYSQAIQYLNTAEEGYRYLSNAHLGMARTYFAMKAYEKAIENLDEAIRIGQEINLKKILSDAYCLLGKNYLKLHQQAKAIQVLHKALAMTEQYEFHDTKIEVLTILAEYYEEMSQFKKANECSKKIIELQSNLILKEKNHKIEGIISQKEEEIIILKKKNKKIEEQKFLLEASNKELERYNSELEQYAFIVAHDLKEPLRNISSFANLITRRYSTQIEEDGIVFLNFISKGAKQMSNLLDDLLIYTTLSPNKLRFRKEDLKKALETIYPSVMNSEIVHFKLNEPPKDIICDIDLLSYVFQHIFSNAIKFNRSPEKIIEISISEEKLFYHFAITDNGVGIEEEYLKKIFLIFSRLNKREYDGTGIGLALVKKIIHFHKGEVWMESTLNQGSTIHFTISKSLKPHQ